MGTKPIQTTKWGTACAQCAIAKAKCSGRSSNFNSKCDRCERLLKQCTDQVHKPRKTRHSRPPQATDTGSSSLEFHSLVSTPEYASSPMAGDLAGESPSVNSQLSGSFDRPSLFRTALPLNQKPRDCFDATSDTNAQNSDHRLSPPLSQSQSLLLRDGEHIDQVLLSKYRTELMPQHPFVVIPEHISAAVLNNHHPVLMMAIRVIASFEGLQTMAARMEGVTRHIADKLFRHSERSLDLLMGIVVTLGWHHYNGTKHSNLNNLLCLAESLVSDLGLNKKLAGDDARNERVIEGQRLLLGVWYLRSSATIHLHQLTPMPFTSYFRQCLANIQNAKAHELDEALVYYVKVQYLAERVTVLKDAQMGRADRGNGGVVPEGFEQEKEAQEREAAMAACQVYRDKLRKELPSGLKDHDMIAMQLNTIDVRISESRESNVLQSHAAESTSRALTSLTSDYPIVDTLLQTASIALKTWFQAWISRIPIARYRFLPSQAVFQLSYAVQALIQSQGGEQGHTGNSSLDQEPSTLALWSAPPSPGALSASREDRPSLFGDEIMVVNRLVAMAANPSDVGKFWAALGEMSEAWSTPGHQVPPHSSLPNGPWDFGENGFDEIVVERGQEKQPTVVDASNTLQGQGFHGMCASDVLILQCGGCSAPLGQPGYSAGALLPPLPMATVPGTSHMPPDNAIQWTGAETWNPRGQFWGASSAAPGMWSMDHENMVQQQWNGINKNPPDVWGEGI